MIFKNGRFYPGPVFVRPLAAHCMVKLNETHFGVIGGITNADKNILPTFYIYDVNQEKWTSMPNMTIGKKIKHPLGRGPKLQWGEGRNTNFHPSQGRVVTEKFWDEY